MILAGALPIQP